MIYKRNYNLLINVLKLLLFIILLFYGNFPLFITASIVFFGAILIEIIKLNITYKQRIYLIFVSFGLFITQIVFNYIYIEVYQAFGLKQLLRNLVEIMLLYAPFLIKNLILIKKYKDMNFPSVEKSGITSFYDLREKIISIKSPVSFKDATEIVADLTRHNNFEYINKNSLTEKYFQEVTNNLEDPHIYLVFSNTGSVASELISTFTKKQYNHTSLSFDENLKTIVSYNGGEKVFPPGT